MTGYDLVQVKKEPFFKRPIDVLLSGIMLLFGSPIILLIALGIKSDGGPVFFRQKRWGRGGQFEILKFRTMVTDADQKFGQLPATVNDPRVTRVGKILRSAGLDELPQILNILKGDMSFVGPRALAVGENFKDSKGNIIRYEDVPGFWERLSVRPGLTSLATIYLPKDVPPEKKFQYDLDYIQNQSFWLDFRLIVLSFWISFRGKWESRREKI